MKKWISLLLALVLALSLCACSSAETGSGENAETSSASGTEGGDTSEDASGEVKTINVFQYKVDTVDQMQNLADMFAAQYDEPIKIEVETIGGDGDYMTALKQKIASDEIPDLFCTSTYGELELYEEYLTDLSDQPWIENCVEGTLVDITKDGKIYGQPLVIETYGFIYNKDLFAQAGIEAAPTTYSELVEVCEQLSAAGITPFVNGYKENWIIAQHFFNGAMLSKVENSVDFATNVGVSASYADYREEFLNMAKLLKLTMDYGMPNSLSEDYSTSCADFAAGNAAIISEGVWIQPTIDELNPDLDLGIFGYLTDDSQNADILPVGVSGFWVIYNQSEYIDILKDFLTWMATSEDSIQSLVSDFKFMPPFVGVEYSMEQLGSISVAAEPYIEGGKTSEWNWTRLPEGFSDDYGPIMQAFCAGEISDEEMLAQFDEITAANR